MSQTGIPRSAEQHRTSCEPRGGVRPGNGERGDVSAVVLAGAGARGAYEAGLPAEMLPALEARGQRPTVFVGTSAGAVAAVLFASPAHLPARQAAEAAVGLWRGVSKDQVFLPFVPRTLWVDLTRYLSGLLRRPGPPPTGLLDTAPPLSTLRDRLDWQQLDENARTGASQAVAVAATVCRTGRTEIVADGPLALGLPRSDDDQAVDHTLDTLTPEHVLASAAVPVAFRPARIRPGGEWYIDGGVRLNAPIKPAIAPGVSRVLVIATDPGKYLLPEAGGRTEPAPSVQDTVAQVFHAALTDRMIEDLRTLSRTNALVESGATAKSAAGRPYRVVEHLFGGPKLGRFGQLGRLARTVLDTRFGGVRRLRHLDLALLTGLLTPGHSRGELLSYVFFEPHFVDAAVELGRRDARRVIGNAHDGGLWQVTASTA
ncbi:patatin-like phospholipase family protein [Streptomyces sp. NPDC014991]|uniref:patatin-like phospholipase family protein n=1 Tax=Streptomyces sp. NPDC014991 TaxID=3364935 RepID=UPI0036FE8A7D